MLLNTACAGTFLSRRFRYVTPARTFWRPSEVFHRKVGCGGCAIPVLPSCVILKKSVTCSFHKFFICRLFGERSWTQHFFHVVLVYLLLIQQPLSHLYCKIHFTAFLYKIIWMIFKSGLSISSLVDLFWFCFVALALHNYIGWKIFFQNAI